MKHLQGKVKSIPVKEVTDGMQVLVYDDLMDKLYVGTIIDDANDYPLISYYGGKGRRDIDRLKTPIVEYISVFDYDDTPITKQLSLKHSQWQSAIDNGEVDSDKIVKFEIIDGLKYVDPGKSRDRVDYQYAKIIPQKKRMYSEEDVDNLIKAWESLPEGHHCSLTIQKWLVDHMKSAIDKLKGI